MNLVVIQDNFYSFYINRKQIVKVEASEPISKEDLDYYRINPFELINELKEK